MRVVADRGHEGAVAQADRDRQGAVCGRRRCGRRDEEPQRDRGCDGARRGRVRAVAGCREHRGRACRRCAADPRGARHEPLLHVGARGRRGRPPVRGGRRDGRRALLPEPADPERDRAAGGVRAAVGCQRRLHDLVDDADPAHRARDAQRRHRHPRGEAARDRARCRRRLRLEARHLRGRGARARRRAPAGVRRQVDGRSQRGLSLHDPRPRRDPGDRAGRHGGGQDHRRPHEADRCDGRLPPARDAGHSAARRVALCGLLRRRGLQLRVHRRVHEHGADRCVPRRRTTGGHVRDRACGRRARTQARHGPGRDPAAELHPRVPGDDRRGVDDRLGRLRRVPRSCARAGRLRGGAEAAGRTAQAGRHETARHRVLDVRRDVRARAVEDPRRDSLRRGRLGHGDDPLPADRDGAGADRHVAARPGP